MAKITSDKAAAEFCSQRGVTVKFQLDGSVRGSYYQPDELGAVRATGASFVEFVGNLAAEEQRKAGVRAEKERLAAEAAEIAEVEAAVANFEPVESMSVSIDLPEGAETVNSASIDIDVGNGDGSDLGD